MSKHTPGPWRVHPYRTKEPHHVMIDVGPSGVAVANVIGAFEQRDAGAEAEANARLIAAAPDLLAALRWADEVLKENGWQSDSPARKTVLAAIAKAEGTSHD